MPRYCLAMLLPVPAMLLPGPAMLLPGPAMLLQLGQALAARPCDAAARPCNTPTTLLPDPAAPFNVTIIVLDHVIQSCYSLMLLDHVSRSVQYQSIPPCNRIHSTTETIFNAVHLMDRSTLVYIYIYTYIKGSPKNRGRGSQYAPHTLS